MKKALASLAVAVGVLVGLAGPALADTGRQELILFAGPGEEEPTVFAIGPISGTGTDVVLDEEFNEETGTFVSEDALEFPQGTAFTTFSGTAEFEMNPVTCVARGGGDAAFDITGGTGHYEGASGSGSGTFRFLSVGQRTDEGCVESEDDPGFFFARLSGTATVPD